MANVNFIGELECTVCFEVPKIETKVFQCQSGHVFCQDCYIKLAVCPTCQKNLVHLSNLKNENGPIRCLVVENLIRLLPTTQICESKELESETPKRDIPFQLSEFQHRQYGKKQNIELPINHPHRKINLATKQKDFNVGGLGSTEVFMAPNGSKYCVYWGRRLPKDCDNLPRSGDRKD